MSGADPVSTASRREKLPAGRRALGSISILLFLAVAFLAGHFLRHAWSLETGVAERALPALRHELDAAADRIHERLNVIEPALNEIAQRISADPSLDTPRSALRRAVQDLPVTGLGVAYARGMHATPTGLDAPYVQRGDNGGRPAWKNLADRLDYTLYEPRNQWYYDTILDGTTWYEPYYQEELGAGVVGVSVPFYREGWAASPREPAGVIYAFIALDDLADFVGRLDLGANGYPFLFTRNGSFLLDPQLDLAAGSSFPNIFARAWERGEEELAAMAVRAIRGRQGYVELADDRDDQDSWVLFRPVPDTQWIVAVRAFKTDYQPSTDELRRTYFKVSGAALLGFFFLGGALFSRFFARWFLSLWLGALGSLALVSTIGAVWYFSDRYPQPEAGLRHDADARRPHDFKIVNQDALEHYLDNLVWESRENSGTKPVFLPTGVFVQSVEFLSAINVKVTGYIWQKYGSDLPGELSRSVLLPEAESAEISEAYRIPCEDYELVGWSFSAILRQDFDYSQYPKDRQDVWLRLRQADFARDVVLVPDLASYPQLNPALGPGVDEGLVLPGFEVTGSFFSYRVHHYTANFGMGSAAGRQESHELLFNVDFRRTFLESIISRVIPVLVCAMILYSLVMTFSKKGDKEALGFSVTTVSLGCAALFFVIVFDHIALRTTLVSPSIIYFEYFYFTLYFMMTLVLVYSLFFASCERIPLADYGDHFLPKLVFWPLFLTVILVQTLMVFY